MSISTMRMSVPSVPSSPSSIYSSYGSQSSPRTNNRRRSSSIRPDSSPVYAQALRPESVQEAWNSPPNRQSTPPLIDPSPSSTADLTFFNHTHGSSPAHSFGLTNGTSPKDPNATTPPFSPPSNRRVHKAYLQHAVSINQSQVPKHSISSSRMSRHLHLTPKISNTNQTPASPENLERYSAGPQQQQQQQQQPHVTPATTRVHRSCSNQFSPRNDANNTQDTLLVDVMKLPKSFHQHNASLSNMTSPPPCSTRSSLMSVIPPMHNVWLEDDDESTDSDDVKIGTKELLKQHLMRARHLSTTSINRFYPDSSSEGTVPSDSTGSTGAVAGQRCRSRKSFAYGSSEPSRNVFDKIKKTFSSKPQPLSTSSIKVLNPLWDITDHETDVDQNHISKIVQPTTPPSSSAAITQTHLAFNTSTPPRSATANVTSPVSASSRLHRHVSTSKLPSSRSTNLPPSPKSHQRSQSTTTKLLSLLGSKGSKASNDTLLGAPLGGSGGLDKSIISAPVNFVHTEHIGGEPLDKMNPVGTIITRTKVYPQQQQQQPRPDRPPIGFDSAVALPEGICAPTATPTLSCSSSSSLQRSSLLASPNTFNIVAADDVSVSTTTSAEDFSPTSSPVPHHNHKLFFLKLNNAADDTQVQNPRLFLAQRPSIESLRAHSQKQQQQQLLPQQQQQRIGTRSRSNTTTSVQSISAPLTSPPVGLGLVNNNSDLGLKSHMQLLPAHSLHVSPLNEDGDTEIGGTAGTLQQGVPGTGPLLGQVHEEGWL